jgi:zinc transporter ZupT
VAEAFGWGALGAAALLAGALIAYLLAPGRRVIAVVMALGTGLLIGSVSFELVDDALEHQALAWVAVMVLLGAGVFTVGDWLLDRRGGDRRKDATGAQADGSPEAIVLGSILDGVPESFVLGLTVLQGGVSVSLLVAIALSNLPEGMSSLQRPQGGRLAEGPGAGDVVGGGAGLGGGRGRRLRRARPGQRPHRRPGPGVRRRGAAGHAGRHPAARGVRGRGRAHRHAGGRRVRDLAGPVGGVSRR